MNAPDRPDGPLMPAWPPASPPALPAPGGWEEPPGSDDAPPPRGFNARVVARAARRYWWQILILWVAGSVGLGTMAYYKIKTSYDATAWLEIRNALQVFGG